MTQSKSVFDIFVDGVTESTHDYLAEQEEKSAESTTEENQKLVLWKKLCYNSLDFV